jgi:hypothetical protein
MPRPVGARRLCIDTHWYAAFNRDNVHLVDLNAQPLRDVADLDARSEDLPGHDGARLPGPVRALRAGRSGFAGVRPAVCGDAGRLGFSGLIGHVMTQDAAVVDPTEEST